MRAVITAILVMLATQAIAEDISNSCHPLTNAIERLQCYDNHTDYQNLSNTFNDKPSSIPKKDVGLQWGHSEDTSAMYNRKDVWLWVSSTNGQGTSYGSEKNARLELRCMDNKTNIYITFDTYINEDQSVRYKIDDDKIKSVYMRPFTSNDGLGIFNGNKAIPFIKNLFDRNKIIFQFKSYRNPSLEFVFNVSGLRNQIAELSKACEWNP